MTTYTNLLDILTKGRRLPKGAEWGIRSVHPDLRSSRGFRWPAKGWAISPLLADELTRGSECPSVEGDGLCTARTWSGMASGGIPAQTLLLTQHYTSDILGQTPDKVRATRIMVVDVVDGLRLIREHGSAADLGGANLYGADLRGAYLIDANLCRANLCGANLLGADLYGANLHLTDLSKADLRAADLTEANLHLADLSKADLCGANLCGANLRGVHLRGTDLCGANLLGALGYTPERERSANLRDADLTGAIGCTPEEGR